MAIYLKEFGKMINKMEKDQKYLKMAVFMKVNL
jgi:hypothetical protein